VWQQHVDLASHVRNTYGYNIDAFKLDVGAVFLIGVLVRIVGCVVMWVADRKAKV
jgi:hypothetical protein